MFVSRKVSAAFSFRVRRNGFIQERVGTALPISHRGGQGQADVQLSKAGPAAQCKAKKSTDQSTGRTSVHSDYISLIMGSHQSS